MFLSFSAWSWLLLALSLLLFGLLFRFHALLILITHSARRNLTREKPIRDFPRFVILVPAHNEELGIAATLGSLHAIDYPKNAYRIIVIADNCQDQTANAARALGVEVLERFDNDKKSKGYALEYAIEKLKDEAVRPDAIVIIDADTRVDRRLLSAFAWRFYEGQDFMQAYYSVSNPDDSWRTQLMTYAFALFNGIWLAGEDGLGLGSSLRGNGMCFSWRGLRRQPWRAYGLAEDLEYSWYLRTSGETVHFVGETRVYGEIISGNAKATQAQRLRWEKGRAELKDRFSKVIDQLTLEPSRKWLLKSDLLMPPLSRWFILTALGLATVALSLASALKASDLIPLSFGLLTLSLYFTVFFYFFTYLSLPFRALALPRRYLLALTRAPLYIIWKLKLFFNRTPVQWVRTERMANQKASNESSRERSQS